MAVDIHKQVALVAAKFAAEVNALIWKKTAEIFGDALKGKLPKKSKKDKIVLEATPKNVKAALYHDYLTQPENGWWTRDNFNYYRPTVKVEGDGVETWYFRKYGDFNNEHPIKVKFSTLVNRWKYFTNEELKDL